jgi:membrane fusion protein, multidrug efflux system
MPRLSPEPRSHPMAVAASAQFRSGRASCRERCGSAATAAVLISLMLTLGGCERLAGLTGRATPAPAAGQTAPANLPEVRTVRAQLGEVETIVRAVGQVRAVESVMLASEIAGIVRAVRFEEGSLVRAGDLLVELDDSRARAELQSARAVRDRAARQVERFEQAASISAAGLTELDTVRTELAQAEALLQLAEIRVADHRIIAPFEGRIGLRMQAQLSPGAFIQPGTPLTTLTSVDPIDIEFAVPEVHLAGLRPGLRTVARSPAFEREFDATVRIVSPQIDPSTRSALVLARARNVLDPGDGSPQGGPGSELLRPGMFVSVRLILGTRADAVLVPATAIQYQGSQASLFIVTTPATTSPAESADEVRARRVTLGERRGGSVEVLEGVEAGERIVISGLQRIRDGTRVHAVEEPSAAWLGDQPRQRVTRAHTGDDAPRIPPIPAPTAQFPPETPAPPPADRRGG